MASSWRWLFLVSTLLIFLTSQSQGQDDEPAEVEPTWPEADFELAKDKARLSLLSRYSTNGQLFVKPYPHIVISDALDPEVYERLEASFPSDADILKLNGVTERRQNFRYDVRGQLLMGREAKGLVSPLWRAFVDYHVSREFFDEVDGILKAHIRKSHPLKAKFSTGLRHNDSVADVLMDCQVAMNSPVRAKSAVRGPHLDSPGEVWAGLLYFRHAKDDVSTGGELQVLECKKAKCTKMSKKEQEKYGTGNTHFRPSDVRVHNTVPYKANQFVLFVNSDRAIHGVTPRSVTHFSRRLVNVVAVRRGVGKLG